MTFPYSNLLTIPLNISSFLSIKSLYCFSLSAARTFWVITCLAVCAAILPKSTGGSNSNISSPTLRSSFFLIYILTDFKVYFLKTPVLSVFSQEKDPSDPGFLPK